MVTLGQSLLGHLEPAISGHIPFWAVCQEPQSPGSTWGGLVSSGWAPAPSHWGGPGEYRGILKEFVRKVQAQISPCGLQNMLWNQKKWGTPKHTLTYHTFVLSLLKKLLGRAWENHRRKLSAEIKCCVPLSVTHTQLKKENLYACMLPDGQQNRCFADKKRPLWIV